MSVPWNIIEPYKEGNPITCDNKGEPGGHDAK